MSTEVEEDFFEADPEEVEAALRGILKTINRGAN